MRRRRIGHTHDRDEIPERIQVAIATIGMIRHQCEGSAEPLDDVEQAAQNATFRSACAALKRYLDADANAGEPQKMAFVRMTPEQAQAAGVLPAEIAEAMGLPATGGCTKNPPKKGRGGAGSTAKAKK